MRIKIPLSECCGQDEIRYICKTVSVVPNTEKITHGSQKRWPRWAKESFEHHRQAPGSRKGRVPAVPEMLLEPNVLQELPARLGVPQTVAISNKLSRADIMLVLFTSLPSVPVYLFPVAVIANYYRLHGLKHRQLDFPGGAVGENPRGNTGDDPWSEKLPHATE